MSVISQKERIINQLMGVIYKDKVDPTVIRVNLVSAIKIFTNHNILLSEQTYETHLADALATHITGKASVDNYTLYAIASIMYDLANLLKIDITKLNAANPNNPFSSGSPEEIKKLIAQWRSDYYGKLSKEERDALVESLEGKMHSDILDKIRNP